MTIGAFHEFENIGYLLCSRCGGREFDDAQGLDFTYVACRSCGTVWRLNELEPHTKSKTNPQERAMSLERDHRG